VKATFEEKGVLLGAEGRALHEQGGYGRLSKQGVVLSFEEALYLLHRGKIQVEGHDFDSFLSVLAIAPGFLRRFLVYRDIRERGYIIQPGPHDFRVFRRGERPGTGRSRYSVRVISERELIDFTSVAGEITASGHMRKQYLLAVVDDEDELTYYEVREVSLPGVAPPPSGFSVEGERYRLTVVGKIPSGHPLEEAWFGTRLDADRLMLSPVESAYLLGRQMLRLSKETLSAEEFRAMMAGEDPEFGEKVEVYTHLRDRGYIVRTGYKFGHHFRVYSGKKPHSEMLVHAIGGGVTLSMSLVSRSVRLAHSVRKKMLFACADGNMIQYIEFSRIKL
jgi:tRNA-intron endonuclease